MAKARKPVATAEEALAILEETGCKGQGGKLWLSTLAGGHGPKHGPVPSSPCRACELTHIAFQGNASDCGRWCGYTAKQPHISARAHWRRCGVVATPLTERTKGAGTYRGGLQTQAEKILRQEDFVLPPTGGYQQLQAIGDIPDPCPEGEEHLWAASCLQEFALEREVKVKVGTAKLAFMGDFHVGTIESDWARLVEFFDWLKNARDAWAVLMGDLWDIPAAKHGTRNAIGKWNANKDALMRRLRSVKSKILVMLDGNHDQRYAVATDQYVWPVRELAEQLDVPFMRGAGRLNLTVRRGRASYPYRLAMHHGFGGGATAGHHINKRLRALQATDADLFVMGHDHQLLSNAIVMETVGEDGQIAHVKRHLLAAGSFQRKFSITYTTAKGMAAVPLGAASATFDARRRDITTRAA